MIRHTSTTGATAALVAMVAFLPSQLVAAETPIKVGDTIVVLHDTHLQIGKEKLLPVKSGTELVAKQVQGHWVWVTIKHEGRNVSGWMSDHQLVVHPKQAFTELTYGCLVLVGQPEREYRRIDKDGNGTISTDEFLAATKLQTLDDLNKKLARVLGSGLEMGTMDGAITHLKLMTEIANFNAWKRQLHPKREVWPMADDFVRTRDIRRSRLAQQLVDREAPTVRAAKARALFAWADKNHDGKLSPEELRQGLLRPKG